MGRSSHVFPRTSRITRTCGRSHLANPKLWHGPSRKSVAMARAISQIRSYGTGHLANRAGWQKRGLPSQESDAMAQTITQIGRNGAMAPDLRDFGPPFVPRRPICVMEGRDSAIASDLRDGEGRVSATASDLRDGEGRTPLADRNAGARQPSPSPLTHHEQQRNPAPRGFERQGDHLTADIAALAHGLRHRGLSPQAPQRPP